MKRKKFKIETNQNHKYQNILNEATINILRKNNYYSYPNRVRWRTYTNEVIRRQIIEGIDLRSEFKISSKLFIKIALHTGKSVDDAIDLAIEHQKILRNKTKNIC